MYSSEEAQQKRANLKALSADLKMAAVMNGIDLSVNELLKLYYEKQGHRNLKTFRQWKQLGYMINKGAQALLIWSEPTKAKDNSKEDGQLNVSFDTPESAGKTKNLSEAKFFHMCYLFSESQVTKMAPRSSKKHNPVIKEQYELQF